MSSAPTTAAPRGGHSGHSGTGEARRRADRLGDVALLAICVFAAVLAAAMLVLIAIEVVNGATLSIDKFGFSFLTGTTWQPK